MKEPENFRGALKSLGKGFFLSRSYRGFNFLCGWRAKLVGSTYVMGFKLRFRWVALKFPLFFMGSYIHRNGNGDKMRIKVRFMTSDGGLVMDDPSTPLTSSGTQPLKHK
jgi:hypothetical protein